MFLRYPIGRNHSVPSTTQYRCRGWRRCDHLRKRSPRPCDPYQDCSWAWAWIVKLFRRCPIDRHLRIPSTTHCRCRGWHRCVNHRKRAQRLFGRYQGCSSAWAWIVKLSRRCPIGRTFLLPSTTHYRCQGWRRRGHLRKRSPRPCDLYQSCL